MIQKDLNNRLTLLFMTIISTILQLLVTMKSFAESYTQLSPESQSAFIFGHTTTPEALKPY